jgi:hypothetical protein
MTLENLINCQDIDWKKIKNFMSEMGGKKPPAKLSDNPTFLEIALISTHTKACPDCRSKLVKLAKDHKIS